MPLIAAAGDRIELLVTRQDFVVYAWFHLVHGHLLISMTNVNFQTSSSRVQLNTQLRGHGNVLGSARGLPIGMLSDLKQILIYHPRRADHSRRKWSVLVDPGAERCTVFFCLAIEMGDRCDRKLILKVLGSMGSRRLGCRSELPYPSVRSTILPTGRGCKYE